MQENSKDEYVKIARQYLLNKVGDIFEIFEDDINGTDDTFCSIINLKSFLKH